MERVDVRRCFGAAFVVAAAVLTDVHVAQAQLTRGFVTRIEPAATGEELNAQKDLWVFEVDFKPMRMISLDVTDPKTRKKKRELIWYLVYKAVNRDLERPPDDSNTTPKNDEDEPPESYFIPEFTLVTNDNASQKFYDDVLIPEAQAAIIIRERLRLKNSVEVIGLIPPVTPRDAKDENAIYGVAMWRGIDPETDYFTVFMTGFSNGYQRKKGPDGQTQILRRTIVQEYWRPGDRFFQNEKEIRQKGEPKWIYRPDEPKDAAAQVGPQPPANKQNAAAGAEKNPDENAAKNAAP